MESLYFRSPVEVTMSGKKGWKEAPLTTSVVDQNTPFHTALSHSIESGGGFVIKVPYLDGPVSLWPHLLSASRTQWPAYPAGLVMHHSIPFFFRHRPRLTWMQQLLVVWGMASRCTDLACSDQVAPGGVNIKVDVLVVGHKPWHRKEGLSCVSHIPANDGAVPSSSTEQVVTIWSKLHLGYSSCPHRMRCQLDRWLLLGAHLCGCEGWWWSTFVPRE